jgi:hypothetical protein
MYLKLGIIYSRTSHYVIMNKIGPILYLSLKLSDQYF